MPSANTFRAIAVACTVAGVLVILFCGGVIDGPARAVAARYCGVLPEVAAPIADSADRQAVLEQIAACPAQVEAGTATLEEVARYTTELHDAADDGALSIGEVLVLERLSDEMGER